MQGGIVVKKKDWMWALFGVFTGFAINIIATTMSPDMIKGLVLGLIFGAIGGIFVNDKFFKEKGHDVSEEVNEVEDDEKEEEIEDDENEKT